MTVFAVGLVRAPWHDPSAAAVTTVGEDAIGVPTKLPKAFDDPLHGVRLGLFEGGSVGAFERARTAKKKRASPQGDGAFVVPG